LLEQDIKQPENGYEGNPMKFMNEKRNLQNKRENLITFQFKSNQTESLHNGQSIGSAGPSNGHESEVYYRARPSRVIVSFRT
jgi:hypothetical protein